jgi:Secretion system C-terminal sorting domain
LMATGKNTFFAKFSTGDSIGFKPVVLKPTTPTALFSETEAVQNDLFTLYPNPNEGVFKIELKENTAAIARIYNFMGELVKEIPLSSSQTLDFQAAPAGLYLLQLETKTSLQTRTFIKK